MYETHFSLSENPFSQKIDSKYLFLSKRHNEALAHLNYAVSNRGSLVVLTGEQGVGKTTLCQKMISDLSNDTKAFVVDCENLDEHELLKIMCNNFGISPKQNCSSKELFDAIINHLHKSYTKKKYFLVCFDGAQFLSQDVLERIDLLARIRNGKKRLASIVLIGQPRLNILLANKNLKELSKRVNARFNLGSLDKNEIESYINYRLSVAGGREKLFSKEAIQKLYACTNGVPGKVNLMASRSLEATFAKGDKLVTAETIDSIANESFARSFNNIRTFELHDDVVKYRRPGSVIDSIKKTFYGLRWWLAGVTLLFFNVFLWQVFSGSNQQLLVDYDEETQKIVQESRNEQFAEIKQDRTDLQLQQSDAPEALKTVDELLSEIENEGIVNSEVNESEGLSIEKELQDLEQLNDDALLTPSSQFEGEPDQLVSLKKVLTDASVVSKESDSLKALASLWKVSFSENNGTANCAMAVKLGLQCLVFSEWEKIYSYNRPAIIALERNQKLFRVVLASLNNSEAVILYNGNKYLVSEKQLRSMWVLPGLIFWKPSTQYANQLLKEGDSSKKVIVIRKAIAEIEKKIGLKVKSSDDQSSMVDELLVKRIIRLQNHFAIETTGLINDETYIMFNEVLKPGVSPVITQRF